MEVPVSGWVNKGGTDDSVCSCGTWKQHWINFAGQPWPEVCSVSACLRAPILGAHIQNAQYTGEHIVPMCGICNGRGGAFSLTHPVYLASANRGNTCGY